MDRLTSEKDRTESGNLNSALDQAALGSDDFLSGELTVAQIHSMSCKKFPVWGRL